MKKLLTFLTITLMASTSHAVTLGTSASSPDPVSSYNSGTGIFSSASDAVSISSVGTEVVRIDATGLAVGMSAAVAPLSAQLTAGPVGGDIARFSYNGSKALNIYGSVNGIGIGTYTNDNMIFWTNNGAPQMVLTTAGYLGVGDMSPASPFSVNLTSAGGDIAKFSINGAKAVNIYGDSNGIGLGTYSNDNLLFWTNHSAPQMVLTTAGFLGVGTAAPNSLLHVGSAAVSGIVAEFQNSAGDCTFTPSAGTLGISCSSDERLKKNIVDEGSALKWLANMRVRNYTIKSTGQNQTGVIAQEMLANHPEMVRTNEKGTYLVEQPNPWKLVKAIQEQQEQINAQQEQMKKDQATIAAMKAKLGI